MDKLSELKAAALAATPGPWNRTITQFNGITNSTHSMASFSSEGVLANANEKRDAIFIAAANPSVVLALLAERDAFEGAALALRDELREARAELEALKIRIGQQQSVAANNLDMFRKADARAETAEQNMELHFKAIEAERGLYRLEREAFKNHIAELEQKLATPVRLPEKFSMLHRTDFHEDYHSTMAFKSDEVFGAIRAAGFTFTVEGGE